MPCNSLQAGDFVTILRVNTLRVIKQNPSVEDTPTNNFQIDRMIRKGPH